MKTKTPSILFAAIALVPALCFAGDLSTGNSITGIYSSANGYGNSIPGSYSFASGVQNVVNGNANVLFGYQNQTVAGNIGYNMCNGPFNVIGGYGNTVFGISNSTINGANGNFISGSSNAANGLASWIGGQNNTATGTQSLLFGSRLTDGGKSGSVLFSDADLTNRGSGLIGPFTSHQFNAVFHGGIYLSVDDINFTNGLFVMPSDFGAGGRATGADGPAFVGINTGLSPNQGGSGTGPRAALDVIGNGLFSGQVGIGTSTPSALLDLSSPNLNGASLLLTSGTFTSSITQKSGTAPDRSLQFQSTTITGTNQAFTFLNANSINLATILSNGNVGIGTTNPTQAKLTIIGNIGSNNFPGTIGFLGSGGAGTANNQTIVNNSIFADGNITGLQFIAFSDERIKLILGRSDSAADLRKLLHIEITDYLYKDVVSKGSRPHKKVIAQQVEKVFPQAVSKSTDVVPDIYQKATVKDGWVQLATNLKVGDRVKLIGENETAVHEVLEVRDGSFRTAFQPATDKVFVYGREVKDFCSVDYDAISTLNVSATQELARKVDAKDAEIADLKKQLASLKASDQARAAEFAALAARDQAREERLARLEAADKDRPARAVPAALGLTAQGK